MAFGNGLDDKDEVMSEINMTPLVDVMLVLLIIFMITVPVLTHSVKLDLPQITSEPNATKTDAVRITVMGNGRLQWNDTDIDALAFEQRLHAAAQKKIHNRKCTFSASARQNTKRYCRSCKRFSRLASSDWGLSRSHAPRPNTWIFLFMSLQITSRFVPPDQGKIAPVHALNLRPDMVVCFWESETDKTEQQYQVQASDAALWFDFALEGHGSTHVREQESLLRSPGSSSMRYIAADTTITLHAHPHERHRWLSLVLAPSFLSIAAPEDWGNLPEPITRLLSGTQAAMQGITRRMTPDQFIAASQLMNCAYTGASRTLYLKSKTIELLAHMLSDQSASGMASQSRLSSYDVACLEKAKNILTTNLSHPPVLRELAAQVGLSETKLKSGFKALFGLPVFEFFRKHRVDVARQILLESDKPVSTVAHLIGYTNVSHFGAAFKEFYGTTPSAYRRQNAEKVVPSARKHGN